MPIEFALKLPMYGQAHDAPFKHIIDLARLAESAGFSSAYVIDHLLLPSDRLLGKTNADRSKPYHIDAWCTLAAVAASTSTIRLGPQVTPIGLRHPVFVAKWGATIDRISEGRFTLGVGLGHQEIEYVSHGFPFPPFKERFARLMDGVGLIRALWTSEEPVTYQSDHYSVSELPFWPKPIQERVPIWFGGASPTIQGGAAKLGDGWFPAAPQRGGLSASFFSDGITSIREQAVAAGRERRIGAGALFMCTISERREDLERSADLLRRRSDSNGFLQYAGMTVEEISEQGAILMGTPAEICERLEPFVAAGVEEFTLSFLPLDDMDGVRRGIELVAEKIAPNFS
jgi:probable F420-dependent oxidoreductase